MAAAQFGLTGSYTLDHKRSESMEPMLELMGVPWLVRKAINQFTPQQVIEHTEATFKVTVNSFTGSNVEGPGAIGQDWTPYKHHRMGDALIKVESVDAGGITLRLRKDDEKLQVSSAYSFESATKDVLLLVVTFSKGDETVTIRRVLTRDA